MNPKDFSEKSPGKVVRTINENWAFVPNPLPPKIPKWSTPILGALAEAERNLTKLWSISDNLPNPHIFVQPFVRKEAMLSSQIEGKISTLEGLYQYEANNASTIDRNNDLREVHNYVRAMDYGLSQLKVLPVSLRLIREIHLRLMEGVRGENQRPGTFRDIQNFIGPENSDIKDARYVPPPVSEMNVALTEMEKYMHANSNLPPLIRIAFIHYQFEAIHPFRDGNGRIGRLLIVFQLCVWGLLPKPFLYISGYLEDNYKDYYDCLLAISQSGDWERWVTFFLNAVSEQSIDAINKINRLKELRSSYKSLFGKGKIAENLLEVVDLLLGYPLITVRQVEKNLHTTYTRAQRNIIKLIDYDILREITGQSRDRLYQADEILNIIKG